MFLDEKSSIISYTYTSAHAHTCIKIYTHIFLISILTCPNFKCNFFFLEYLSRSYTHTHICTHTCMHLHTHTCIQNCHNFSLFSCLNFVNFFFLNESTNTHLHTHLHTHIYTHPRTSTFTHIYTHLHTSTHIHHIRTYIYRANCFRSKTLQLEFIPQIMKRLIASAFSKHEVINADSALFCVCM